MNKSRERQTQGCPGGYNAPRWSGEILDCSMPVTMDTYSVCSYSCLYCFSFFQRINVSGADYVHKNVKSVTVDRVKKLFLHPEGTKYEGIIKPRRAVQWGSLSDQFDENERRNQRSLELLRFFREIEYPISISTKGTWWLEDPRYIEAIKGAKNFHFKISIITRNERKAKKMEVGVPTIADRLKAIEKLKKLDVGGITLRFRPFIMGMSNPDHKKLIADAGRRGADSISTEFLCIESRAGEILKARYSRIGQIVGFDLYRYYRKMTRGGGYLRLNRELKRPFIFDMKEAADAAGMRFYVSDAHWKELSHHGSCCGIPEDWNYTKGQFTEAAVICRRKGTVRFGDIGKHLNYAKKVRLGPDIWTTGFGSTAVKNQTARAQWKGLSLYDYFRYVWNHPDKGNSPYRYFGGALRPIGLDKNGDVIYKYQGDPEPETT